MKQVPAGHEADALIQLFELIFEFLLRLLNAAHDLQGFDLKIGRLLFEFVFNRLLQLGVLFLANRFTVDQGHSDETGTGPAQGKSLFLSGPVQFLQNGGAALLELLDVYSLLALVILAVKGLGNGFFQVLHQLFHVADENGALTGREIQGDRLALIFKVEHVTPVGGHRFEGSDFFNDRLGIAGLAGSGQAGNEDVIPRLFDG